MSLSSHHFQILIRLSETNPDNNLISTIPMSIYINTTNIGLKMTSLKKEPFSADNIKQRKNN
jgi:hypothetical protein